MKFINVCRNITEDNFLSKRQKNNFLYAAWVHAYYSRDNSVTATFHMHINAIYLQFSYLITGINKSKANTKRARIIVAAKITVCALMKISAKKITVCALYEN